MKKILSILFLFTSILMFGQDTTKNITPSQKKITYISAGLSMSSADDFYLGSYPSVELGLMGDNISGGLIFGRSNLKDIGKKANTFVNNFLEAKTSISRKVNKNVIIYSLCGIGAYGDLKRIFVEYGVGFSYSFGSLSYFVQSSNWDGTWYITPGLSYNL